MGNKEDNAMNITIEAPEVYAGKNKKAFERLGKAKKKRLFIYIPDHLKESIGHLCKFLDTNMTALVNGLIEAEISKYPKLEEVIANFHENQRKAKNTP